MSKYLEAVQYVPTACCITKKKHSPMLYPVFRGLFLLSISGQSEPIANLLNIHQNLPMEVTAFWTPPSFVLFEM